jgi:hypothetical protein
VLCDGICAGKIFLSFLYAFKVGALGIFIRGQTNEKQLAVVRVSN